MKVYNLTSNDYSNFAYTNCLALRSVGIECIALTLTPHTFSYEKSSHLTKPAALMRACADADLIQVFHSDPQLLALIPKTKRVFVYHTGTRYRQHPEKMNLIWNARAERCFYDSPEFAELGAKNATYIATAIDIDSLPAVPQIIGPTVFAHYPSMPHVKGTATIMRIASQRGVSLITSTDKIPHPENMVRMASCDCYIEMLCTEQTGHHYGSFGVTAFEAAAMGKLVITNSTNHHIYESTYGDDEMLIANSEKELAYCIDMAKDFRREDSMKIRQWIADTHSLTATGNYLKKFL